MMNPENIVRYYGCWFEELDEQEKKVEMQYRADYVKVIQAK